MEQVPLIWQEISSQLNLALVKRDAVQTSCFGRDEFEHWKDDPECVQMLAEFMFLNEKWSDPNAGDY